MFERTISNDAHNVLCVMYKIYLDRRNAGVSKDNASMFDAPESLIEEHSLKLNVDDLYSSLEELGKNGLIVFYNNGCSVLENDAIVYMENRFKKGVSDVLEIVSVFF